MKQQCPPLQSSMAHLGHLEQRSCALKWGTTSPQLVHGRHAQIRGLDPFSDRKSRRDCWKNFFFELQIVFSKIWKKHVMFNRPGTIFPSTNQTEAPGRQANLINGYRSVPCDAPDVPRNLDIWSKGIFHTLRELVSTYVNQFYSIYILTKKNISWLGAKNHQTNSEFFHQKPGFRAYFWDPSDRSHAFPQLVAGSPREADGLWWWGRLWISEVSSLSQEHSIRIVEMFIVNISWWWSCQSH